MSTTKNAENKNRRLPTPATDKNFLAQALNRARENENVLGDLCKFGFDGVELPPETLFKMLKSRGLEGWGPVPIRKKTAARKAITRIRPQLEEPESDLRVIVRPVHTQEANVVRYAIIDEQTDNEALDLDFSTRNQVVFRTDTGTMEFTESPVEEIVEMFDYLCSVYTDSEVTLMVKNIIEGHVGVHLPDGSGMFFMGHPVKPIVDKLVGLFKDINNVCAPSEDKPVCYFRPIAIIDDSRNRATMGQALLAEINVELNEATEMLNEAIKDGTTKRKVSAQRALKRFNVAQGKANIYKDMLQINVDTVEAQIKKAQEDAAALIVELSKKTMKEASGDA